MKKQIAAAIALACASSFALAQAKQDTGWYLGGSVGRSNTGFTKQDYRTGIAGMAETTTSHDTGYKALIGYNFDRNWAVEGAYTSLGEPKYKYTGTGANALAGNGEAKLTNDAWSVSAKGTIPINQQFDFFGRLGVTYNRSELNATASSVGWFDNTSTPKSPLAWSVTKKRSDALLGLGFEFKPQKNWGIRAEYENYGGFGNKMTSRNDTGRTSPDLWSLGAVVRF